MDNRQAAVVELADVPLRYGLQGLSPDEAVRGDLVAIVHLAETRRVAETLGAALSRLPADAALGGDSPAELVLDMLNYARDAAVWCYVQGLEDARRGLRPLSELAPHEHGPALDA